MINYELKRRDLSLAVLLILPISLIITGLVLSSPREILTGYLKILSLPDVLLQDYLALAGPGAGFLNAGILGLIYIGLIYGLNVYVNSTVISSVLTLIGFGFIGKNILNVLPIFLGGYIYSRYTRSDFKSLLPIFCFGTTLAPVVSYSIFGFNLPLYKGLPLALLLGISIGFIIVPLSKHMIDSHAGYNIYNIGFVGGIIGMVLVSILRAFGLDTSTEYIVSSQYSKLLMYLMLANALVFIIAGYLLNKRSFKGYGSVFKYSGRLMTTFIEELGYGVAYINIGIMGLICIFYVRMVQANFNGPVVAAILTAAGFSTSGKNPANVFPVLLGVFLTTKLKAFDVASTSVVIAALFGTTLAPIAGVYGFIPGVIAGALHLCISPNLAVVHGGLHLYNNGFSGGIVAMVMAPILETFFNKKENII